VPPPRPPCHPRAPECSTNAVLFLRKRARPEIVPMQLKPGHHGNQIHLSVILHADKAIETSGWSDPRLHSPTALRGKGPSHASQSGQRRSGLLNRRERGEDVADVEIQEMAKAADMPRAAACRQGDTPRDCIELPAEGLHGPHQGDVELSSLGRR